MAASFLLTKREKGEVSRWAKEKAPTSTNNKLASDEEDEEDSRKILLESFSFDVKVDGGLESFNHHLRPSSRQELSNLTKDGVRLTKA